MILKQLLLCIAVCVLYEADGREAKVLGLTRSSSKALRDAKQRITMNTFQEPNSLACSLNNKIKKPRAPVVPAYRRPWKRQYFRYNPKFWNESCYFRQCDPPIGTHGFHPKFNTIDGTVYRKRLNCCGENLTYEVRDGFPLNPAGRTGLTGRGLLPRYGPNHMRSVIFIWENGTNVLVLKKSNTDSYGDGFITGHIGNPEEQAFADLPLKLIKESLKQEFPEEGRVDKILKNARKRFVKLVGGSLPSILETDNAWVELEMFVVPCKKTKKLCRHGLTKMREAFNLTWHDMKMEDPQALNKSVTSLTESKREDEEEYSIYCEKWKKETSLLSIIFGSILLIGGIGLSIALAVSLGTAWAVGAFIALCLGGNGLLAIGFGIYDKFAK